MNKFQVTVDPELEAIIPRYMEIRFEELAQLEQAIADEDGETARMLGHKLKGTGASYGFEKLTELGAAIEISAKDNDLATARDLAVEVRSYIENVEVVYEK